MAKNVKRKPVITPEETDEDVQFLQELADKVNKTLERDTIMVGDNVGDSNVPYWILTGIPALDFAIGGKCHPGIPGARITEIFGPEAVGKSTLTLWIMKQAIEQQRAIAYHQDAERVLTPEIIKGTGINMNRVMRDQPDTLEEAFDAQEAMLEELQGRKSAVVTILDSIAACSTMAEIEGDMGDSHVGLQARLMSQALRKLTSAISRSNCIVIFINQLREKIGVMFGNPETTTGGRALKFYASVRLDVRRIESLKQQGEVIGNRTKVKVVKNKVAPPFKEAEFDIMFGKGISREADILDLAEKNDIIEKSGAWYAYQGDKIGQGRENAKLYLQEHPEMCLEVERKVREKYGLDTGSMPEAPEKAEPQE